MKTSLKRGVLSHFWSSHGGGVHKGSLSALSVVTVGIELTLHPFYLVTLGLARI